MKIATHHDADGISSAVLYALYLREKGERFEITYPEFGEINDEDVCLDMCPINSQWKGKCIDHHDNHPAERGYELVWENNPTSLIVYKMFRDIIPQEHWWKVVVGVVGDGEANKIPAEIWELHPELLEEIGYIKATTQNLWSLPLYNLLSSPINASCRIGAPELAFATLLVAEKPQDVIENADLKRAQEEVRKEEDRIFKLADEGMKPVVIGPFVFWVFESKFRMGGILAIKLAEMTRKTAIVYNTQSRTGSIRGDLASYVVSRMNGKNGIKAGGHPGFAGFRVIGSDEIDLERIIREVTKELWKNL